MEKTQVILECQSPLFLGLKTAGEKIDHRKDHEKKEDKKDQNRG
jgi:hypothetical protein